MNWIPIFAQEAGAPAPGADAGTGQADTPAEKAAAPQVPFLMRPEIMFVLLGVMVVVMMFSKRRNTKELAAKMAAMKPGSKILTNSGIIGRIVTIKDGDDEVVIKSEDTKLRIMRGTITTVLSDETPAETKA